MPDKELEDLLTKLNIFETAYDRMRLVDPVNKQLLNLHNKQIENTGSRCFDFWGKNKVCDDCVSLRAYQDNQIYVKMEYSTDEVYMLTAIPIEMSDRRIVLELLKNVTNNLIMDGKDQENYSEFHAMLDSMNTLALKDSLTGIYNRRYINERLPIDLTNTVLHQKNISIIMADIDFFKKVNDTYGHLAGDCTLINFAKILSDSLTRDHDWVARYGGEEFLICLPGAGQSRAVEIAEIMRKKVEQSIFDCGGHNIQITASFGVCTIDSDTELDMDAIIEGADKNLYKAKRNGRNRVEA